MSKVRDNQTGQEYELAGQNLQKALNEGAVTLVGGAEYVDPKGEVRVIEDVSGLEHQGLQINDPAARGNRALESYYESRFGTPEQQALTFGEGFLSGGTFGFSDELLADDTFLRYRARQNPGVRTVAEITGAAVPGLLSGGAGAVGSTARLLPSGALVARTSKLGTVAASAAEGAAFGAGQAISELAIKDIPLTSEAGVAHVGLGAVFGAGLGAGVGALTYGAGKVAARLENRVSARAEAKSPLGKMDADDYLRREASLGSDLKVATTRLNAATVDAKNTAARVRDGNSVVGTPKQLAGWVSESQQVRNEVISELYASARRNNQGQIANELSGELRKLSGITKADRLSPEKYVSATNKLGNSEKLIRKYSHPDDLEGLLKRLDDVDNKWHSATGSGQIAPRTAGNVVMPPREPSPLMGKNLADLDATYQAFKDAHGGSSVLNESTLKRFVSMDQEKALLAAKATGDHFETLGRFTKQFPDQELSGGVEQSLDEIKEAIKKTLPEGASGKSAAEILELIGKPPAEPLSGLADDMMKLWLTGNAARSASEAVQKGALHTAGRFAGYKAAATLGSKLGLSGMPAFVLRSKGAAFGGAAMAGLGALGNATGAVLARTESAITKLLKGVSKGRKVSVPSAINTLGKARFLTQPEDDGKKPRHDLYSAFNARRDELTTLLADPMAAHRLAYDNLTSIRQVHPEVADAMEMKSVEAAQFLLEKMPKDPGTVNALGQSRWKPSEADLIRWGNYIRAVQDPLSVLEDAANGTVTPQGAEALRTVYPAIFAKAQEILVTNAATLQKNSTYDQRVRLSVLFGVAVDSSVSPEFSKFSQQMWSDRLAEAKPIDGAQLEPNEPTETQKALT